jgi:glycosyltransferase involved in cell wall biosynthesis
MKITVIVPTQNRSESLRQTILSIQAQDFPVDSYEILVVDNNSTDNTKDVVEKCNSTGKEIKYIFESEVGLHNARHTGAKFAQGEILAYADDDVICDPKWLKSLFKHYANRTIGCVGGKILPKWQTQPPAWLSQFEWALSLSDAGNECLTLYEPKLIGCNMSIRRSLLYEVGGFHPDAMGDPRLIWYRGDGEVGLQVKVLETDQRIVYEPAAVVWHVIPAERMTITSIKRRHFIEGISSSFESYRKRKFNAAALLFRICIHTFVAMAAVFLSVVLKLIKSNRHLRYFFLSSHFQGRFQHELRLLFSPRLRKWVLRSSWLK